MHHHRRREKCETMNCPGSNFAVFCLPLAHEEMHCKQNRCILISLQRLFSISMSSSSSYFSSSSTSSFICSRCLSATKGTRDYDVEAITICLQMSSIQKKAFRHFNDLLLLVPGHDDYVASNATKEGIPPRGASSCVIVDWSVGLRQHFIQCKKMMKMIMEKKMMMMSLKKKEGGASSCVMDSSQPKATIPPHLPHPPYPA